MAPPEKPLRVALIGFGVSGSVFHGPLLRANPRFRVDVVVTSHRGRQDAARRLLPRARLLTDFDALLGELDSGACALDVVVLCTPPAGHREQALAAIHRGLAVVVDKPFAASSQDARAIIDAAEQHRTPLTVFQNRRWDGDFLTLKQAVDDGRLGTVRTFESRFEWWMPQGFGTWRDAARAEEGGGILFDLGTHLVDQALQLFGPARPVLGQLRDHPDSFTSGADSDTFVVLQHDSGVISRLWMSMLAPAASPRFTVQGSRAGFQSHGLDPQEDQLSRGLSPTDPDYGLVRSEPGSGPAGPALHTGSVIEPLSPVRGDYPAFYERLAGVLRGDGPMPVDPRDALVVLELIEHIRRDADSTAPTNR
ncbi:oxidoreductase [Arthrobacter woluwensis]|uniref:Gfo/Idh/MocA family protein n=1 Tax=Arthrobacter woluwensis TaxID=156980 RepID=UPI000D1275F3|nr:Gfo/Idh/MocA family oxidoreductase [Arthrobacter woluwensis]PSS42984.1 oxidoreductase [Arthrobacter woluwensis]